MKNKVYIRDYSRKEIAVLLEECFYIIGKSMANLDNFHIETMINGVLKYNSNMWYDSFKEAFEMAIDLNVDIYGTPSPAIIGKIIKAYRSKDGHNVAPKKVENAAPHGLPPATDEDYYNGLICAIEGRFSERHKMVYGEQKYPVDLRPNDYPMLPDIWAWDNVYRHLRILNQVDEVGEKFEKQMSAVMTWIYTKYPNVKRQEDILNKSPLGKSMKSPRSRAEQLRNQFWNK